MAKSFWSQKMFNLIGNENIPIRKKPKYLGL